MTFKRKIKLNRQTGELIEQEQLAKLNIPIPEYADPNGDEVAEVSLQSELPLVASKEIVSFDPNKFFEIKAEAFLTSMSAA